MSIEGIGASSVDFASMRARFRDLRSQGAQLGKEEMEEIRSQADSGGKTLEELSEMQDKLRAAGHDPEALNAVVENFDQADANQDGLVSRSEFGEFAQANGLELRRPPRGMRRMMMQKLAESDDDESDTTSSQSLVSSALQSYVSASQSLSTTDTLSLLNEVKA